MEFVWSLQVRDFHSHLLSPERQLGLNIHKPATDLIIINALWYRNDQAGIIKLDWLRSSHRRDKSFTDSWTRLGDSISRWLVS